jgi:2-polyprenyl-3-methyl-5-hydroxy-6-metoxy-1,4-benzoquinol methylase
MIQAVNGAQRSGLSAALTTEDVPCGVCGQAARRRLFTERYQLGDERVLLGINRCSRCGQVYVSPRLNRASIDQVYRGDHQHTISHNYCWSGQTSNKRFNPLLDHLVRLAPAGRLLDVGCGTGRFLEAAAARARWQLAGIDPCVAAATEASQRLGVSVLPVSLEQTSFPPHEFAVITLLGVLEHLHHPLETLRTVHQLLRSDGMLAIYVPNFHYLRWKDAGPLAWLRRRRWSCLAPQEHLFHFTPRLLGQLLNRSGFELLRLDVGQPFLSGNRWRRWFKQSAFAATVQLHKCTGLHVGGLEAIARPR